VEYALALVVLALVVAAVLSVPLRRRGEEELREETRLAELEAAKEAKYREIRDAELDHRTGKVTREDWERLDASLRAEALDILHRIDALEAAPRSPDRG